MGKGAIGGEGSQGGVEGVEAVGGGGDGAGRGPLHTVLVCEGRAGPVVVYELSLRENREGGVRLGVL